MGLRVKRRCRCHGLTHGVPLLVAKTAVVTGFGGGGAAPSAACRRLAALMELDEQAEEQRRAAKLQAQHDKAAAAHKAAEAQGIDPKTKEINRYIAAKFAAWIEYD